MEPSNQKSALLLSRFGLVLMPTGAEEEEKGGLIYQKIRIWSLSFHRRMGGKTRLFDSYFDMFLNTEKETFHIKVCALIVS